MAPHPDTSEALADFSHLTPDYVLDQIEKTLACSCTNLCRPLNSYINRVYEVQTADGRWVIIKFYRPGRWSESALRDELTFLRELAGEEIPVVAPLVATGDGLSRDAHGVFFSIFPKMGGRPLVEPSPDRWRELGRLLARVHAVGARQPPENRVRLHPEYVTLDHLDAILAVPFPYESLRLDYADAVEDLIDMIVPRFDDLDMIRIHGDCHAQNLLDRPDEPLTLIDFDDMAVGPAIQDLWMLLPDRLERARPEFSWLREGYATFRSFPDHETKIIESLRAMRYVHYTAWCARQKADGGFNRLSPDWGSESYWKKEMDDLRRQMALIRQAP
ncbi:MAG TPA: serine/threonine protein kinase [Kiritimatiellia bacterium]|nr:serine/threonine protein kinase [Kiritimatiellia bacterium]